MWKSHILPSQPAFASVKSESQQIHLFFVREFKIIVPQRDSM